MFKPDFLTNAVNRMSDSLQASLKAMTAGAVPALMVFDGNITLDENLALGVANETLANISVVFDDAAIDSNPFLEIGHYNGGIESIVLSYTNSLGDNVEVTTGTGPGIVSSSNFFDSFAFAANATGDNAVHFDAIGIESTWTDPTSAALSNDFLPDAFAAAASSPFWIGELNLVTNQGQITGEYTQASTITEYTASVPETPIVLLLATGLLGIGLLARRKPETSSIPSLG